MAKNIVSGVFCIILGGALLVAGIGTLSQPNAVTCDGQTMSQGDTCVEMSNDSSDVSRDYALLLLSNQGGVAFEIIGGLVFLVVGIFLLPRSEYPSVGSSSLASDQRFQASRSSHPMPRSSASQPSSSRRTKEQRNRQSRDDEQEG